MFNGSFVSRTVLTTVYLLCLYFFIATNYSFLFVVKLRVISQFLLTILKLKPHRGSWGSQSQYLVDKEKVWGRSDDGQVKVKRFLTKAWRWWTSKVVCYLESKSILLSPSEFVNIVLFASPFTQCRKLAGIK